MDQLVILKASKVFYLALTRLPLYQLQSHLFQLRIFYFYSEVCPSKQNFRTFSRNLRRHRRSVTTFEAGFFVTLMCRVLEERTSIFLVNCLFRK